LNIHSKTSNPIKSNGSLLKQRREASGISQKDLAELTGLSVHTISDIELGKGNPTLVVVGKLCECLGLELVLQPWKIE